MSTFRDLIVYKKAFELAMEIYMMVKKFPVEEKYSLTNQIVRSSRSVCANIAEGYRKRKYVNHFVSKLTDADMENSETQVWLEFSVSCKYVTDEKYKELLYKTEEVGKLLQYMINNPEKYGS
jgi:four helix bundle protein